MENNRWHILSTRPLGTTIIDEAASASIKIDTLSFIETTPIQSPALHNKIIELSRQQHTVIFTSMNAIEAIRPHLSEKTNWSIYSIGQTTQQLAADIFGPQQIKGTAAYAVQLAERIINDDVEETVFFCGNIRRDELPQVLRQNNIQVEEVIVYETKETPHQVNGNYDAILFYSPSAVKSFFRKNTVNEKTVCFAIGTTTAEALEQTGIVNIITAEEPGKDNLVKRAIDHFRTKNR